MDEQLFHIGRLIIKQQDGSISAEGQTELNNWLERSEENKKLLSSLSEGKTVFAELQKYYAYSELEAKEKLLAAIPKKVFYLSRWAAAASILLLICIGSSVFYYVRHKKNIETSIAKNNPPADIKAPATNRATITLSGGQKIFLDSVADGELATQGNIKLVKLADGKIAYNGNAQPKKEIIYNLLTNPRGSKVISLALSDGTVVWLNAESSIKYPAAFAATERTIEITGEAYFEVAHDPAKPFLVKKDNTTVQVLGTHFNVNAYDDQQQIRVTLLEGSVKVSNQNNSQFTIIKPGQQAIAATNGVTVKNNIDLEEVMAWKNGLFDFKRQSMPEIMKELGRWYDVQVSYQGNMATDHYSGMVSREKNISEVLRIMEQAGARFKIEDNKITVIE